MTDCDIELAIENYTSVIRREPRLTLQDGVLIYRGPPAEAVSTMMEATREVLEKVQNCAHFNGTSCNVHGVTISYDFYGRPRIDFGGRWQKVLLEKWSAFPPAKTMAVFSFVYDVEQVKAFSDLINSDKGVFSMELKPRGLTRKQLCLYNNANEYLLQTQKYELPGTFFPNLTRDELGLFGTINSYDVKESTRLAGIALIDTLSRNKNELGWLETEQFFTHGPLRNKVIITELDHSLGLNNLLQKLQVNYVARIRCGGEMYYFIREELDLETVSQHGYLCGDLSCPIPGTICYGELVYFA